MTFTARSAVMAAAAAVTAVSLAACNVQAPVETRFHQTGELLALSGGDAGARAACTTCHGLQGQGDGNLVPRLAGLNPGYFMRQIDYFAEGQRHHPQMHWIAKNLSNDDRLKLAEYYAAMPVPKEAKSTLPAGADSGCSTPIATLYHRGDPEREIAPCAACHGANGQGLGPANPPLYAQPAPYMAEQLRHWRRGNRYGDPQGVMHKISLALREDEIRPLADYSAALAGGNDRPELPEVCLEPRRPGPRSGV